MPKPSLTIGARAWLSRRLTMRVQPFNTVQQFGLPLYDVPEKPSAPAGEARGDGD